MSDAAIDAIFREAVDTLTVEEQYELAQRIVDHYVEHTKVERASLSDEEIIRRQKKAIEETHGMFDGPPDLSVKHDEYLYDKGVS
jgi:hypothetical protein